MPSEAKKPVIFLAFANERNDQVGYLRNLPQEARNIRKALDLARRNKLCDVVERSNSTLKDILEVFQDPEYRNRIAVFHYGGHANGYQLLLESAEGSTVAAHAGVWHHFWVSRPVWSWSSSMAVPPKIRRRVFSTPMSPQL